MTARYSCIVMGTPGRDYHDVQTFLRAQPHYHVIALTEPSSTFVPGRGFPRELAGPGYDADIPIVPEGDLAALISRGGVDFVFLSASGLSQREVMRRASMVQAAGASFVLLSPRHTQLTSTRPVIAVTAVRTGAGKSPLSLSIAQHLARSDRRVAVVRHPQPQGDLRRRKALRFASYEDLAAQGSSLAEREEVTPFLELGFAVYTGIDYRTVLSQAEAEADVILWDGGDNDAPFIRPDLCFCVVDALRPGDELAYHPGELNLRAADVVVINKVGRASPAEVEAVRRNVRAANPVAVVLRADLQIEVENAGLIADRRVLCVEDGHTITHGGMPYGAALLAAHELSALEVIDPRPHAVGSIRDIYAAFPHIGPVLPAVGYTDAQCDELAETIARAGADLIVDASSAHLDVTLPLAQPVVRVRYRFRQRGGPPIDEIVDSALQRFVED